jgi:hypothetical protein
MFGEYDWVFNQLGQSFEIIGTDLLEICTGKPFRDVFYCKLG